MDNQGHVELPALREDEELSEEEFRKVTEGLQTILSEYPRTIRIDVNAHGVSVKTNRWYMPWNWSMRKAALSDLDLVQWSMDRLYRDHEFLWERGLRYSYSQRNGRIDALHRKGFTIINT